MPSYLILRVISFLTAVAIPLLLFKPMEFAIFSMPLTIAHYLLAVPYSKKYVVDAMKRPTSGTLFMLLIAASVVLAWINVPTMLFITFGIHYVFSEVYLMYENTLPNQWKNTKAIRLASVVCNSFVYFASTRYPTYGHRPQMELFYWTGYAVSACVLTYLIFKARNSLTKEQLMNVFAFESLGLAFVIMGLIHPVSLANFIFYHVLFWVLYPSWRMTSSKQTKPLMVFLGANIALTALIVLLSPYSPLPYHWLSREEFFQWYSWGALVHIIISLGMSTAQPGWITRLFHPDFERRENLLSPSAILGQANFSRRREGVNPIL